MDTTMFVFGQLNKQLNKHRKLKFSCFIEIIYLWIMRYIITWFDDSYWSSMPLEGYLIRSQTLIVNVRFVLRPRHSLRQVASSALLLRQVAFPCFVAAICRTNSNQFEFVQQIAATMIFTCHTRRFVAASCRGDVSQRFVASCVSAFKRLLIYFYCVRTSARVRPPSLFNFTSFPRKCLNDNITTEIVKQHLWLALNWTQNFQPLSNISSGTYRDYGKTVIRYWRSHDTDPSAANKELRDHDNYNLLGLERSRARIKWTNRSLTIVHRTSAQKKFPLLPSSKIVLWTGHVAHARRQAKH